ncbi:MAG TPA: leucine--tRNA ligase [Candidatus Acidoferrales bacterium]|nr:leucine--tRNA ligase [Candidatus Acidoferrales bacterium]
MAVAKERTERYDPTTIEAKWQEEWKRSGLHDTPDTVEGKKNFYYLTMFPYPSGVLHVGHWYAFAAPDAVARQLRMRGYNVLFPMGFDAFGLPAENAAIKAKAHPAPWTDENMAHMRKQFRAMGAAIDWRREVVTCYPEYYRWNQWIFLKFLEHGLAYRGKAPVNWCPKDQTVLANEQVISGKCERCGTAVIKRDLEQWFFRITKYADELLRFDGLDWPERVRVMQTNWIGRSEGAEITFPVEGHPGADVRFFTTRPDTIYGATFMVLAPEHALVERITTPAQREKVRAYTEKARNTDEIERTTAEREKTGVFTGAFAKNVFSGERIPIWIADYVLATYGTGAIMAVPGHDERDFAFAKKFDLPIREVISQDGAEHGALREAYIGERVMVRSGPHTGTSSEAGKAAIAAEAKRRGIGGPSVTYRLRDWLISRQRYWGTPIPVVYCDTDGVVPVPYDQLPVVLPRDAEFHPEGGNPLAKVDSFVNTTCPTCGKAARRETDTLDTFMDSSWYMYRYVDPKIQTTFMNKEIGHEWLPVNMYAGGIEHAILHLLYMRFVCKGLRDIGELWFDEPALRLRNQGVIVFGGTKMSKSRGNVKSPDEYTERYGADTLRLFMMFLGPWSQGADWDPSGIDGCHRFLRRVWELGIGPRQPSGARDVDVDRVVHRTIKKVSEDIDDYAFNTAISAMMELSNTLQHASGPSREDGVSTLILLLAPFAPYIAEELWHRCGGTDSVHRQSWPAFDAKLAAANEVTIVIQIDGKVRDRMVLPAGLPEGELRTRALASAKAMAALAGATPTKVVVVPDRLVSIVTK